MKKIGLIFTLLSSLVLFNCSKAKDNLVSMYNLKENIENTYNTDQIDIKVNEDEYNIAVLITITDPKFDSYSVKQKRNMAKTIGAFAINATEETSKTKTAELLFKNETNLLLVKKTDSEHYKMY